MLRFPGHYILQGKEPVPEPSIVKWGKWFEESGEQRRVACTVIDTGEEVSTVFLAIDHNFISDGPPILFETMVFGGKFSDYVERYSTWEEAEAGYKRIVDLVIKGELE